jgi:hypothetical protein
MLADRTVEGFWFLPGSDVKLRGSLDFSPANGIRLNLEGTFGDRVSARRPVIFGSTWSGSAVTLARCFVDRSEHSSGGYQTDRYYATFVLVGAHLPEPETAPFAVYRVRLWNLEEFVGQNGLSLRWENDAVQATGTKPVPSVAQCQGFRVETHHEIRSSESEPFSKAIEQRTYLNVTCQPALSFIDFVNGPLRSIHTLVELAVDGAVPLTTLLAFPTTVTWPVRTEAGWEIPDETEILFHQRCPLPPRERRHSGELAFTVAGLGDEWENCLQRWHRANTTFRLTFDHYFSLSRTVGMADEHRFVSIVQALESYHRRAFPDAVREPQRDFKERKRRLAKSVEAGDRRWLLEALQYSNEARLRDRMRALWRMMPEVARKRLGAEDDFAARVTHTRNWLTHGGPPRGAAVKSGTQMTDLTLQLALVLRVIFILELGLDAEQVLGTAWGDRVLVELR